MKEHKFIVLTAVSLPSSSSLLKVPNDDDGGGVGDIGSRAVNNDDNDDDDQHYRSTYDIYNIAVDMFPLFIKSVKEKP